MTQLEALWYIQRNWRKDLLLTVLGIASVLFIVWIGYILSP